MGGDEGDEDEDENEKEDDDHLHHRGGGGDVGVDGRRRRPTSRHRPRPGRPHHPPPKRSKGFRAGGPREYTRSVMARVGKIATRTRRHFRFQTLFPQLSASVEERKMETISPPPKNVL